jgi:hypothetical protein
MQFYQVQFRAVAFMLAEAILRKTRAEVAHNRIARHFRDYGRGRDAETVAIAVDDRGLRQRKGKNREAVDENVLRLKGEGGDGRAHRLVGRAQDVDHVDLDRINDAYRPRDSAVRHEIAINFFAFLRQQLFRIVQLPVPEFLRENYRGGYDRSGEGTTSRFVDAGDTGDTERPEFAFMPETTATVHRHTVANAEPTGNRKCE